MVSPASEERRGPAFGLSRPRTTRIEINFVFKNGGALIVFQDTGQPVTEESLDAFARELSEQLGNRPQQRVFADDWDATGQRAWVNLAEVSGFSLRPAR